MMTSGGCWSAWAIASLPLRPSTTLKRARVSIRVTADSALSSSLTLRIQGAGDGAGRVVKVQIGFDVLGCNSRAKAVGCQAQQAGSDTFGPGISALVGWAGM